jgi:hypothetical protein
MIAKFAEPVVEHHTDTGDQPNEKAGSPMKRAWPE